MRLLLLALVLLVGGPGAQAQPVRFASVAVPGVAAGPEISGWLYRPAGTAPAPAIVLAHTCAGVNDHTQTWARLLQGWGYVVLAPDSFGPRGEKSVCSRGNVVSGSARASS